MHMADNQFTSDFLLLRCISLHWHERTPFLDARGPGAASSARNGKKQREEATAAQVAIFVRNMSLRCSHSLVQIQKSREREAALRKGA